LHCNDPEKIFTVQSDPQGQKILCYLESNRCLVTIERCRTSWLREESGSDPNLLTADQFTELAQNVASLPTELTDEDEEAKRFDLLILRTQLSILQANPDFDSLRDKIIDIAHALEAQEAIPVIRAQMVLTQSMTTEEWWQDVTVAMLETARKRLRELVKLIEKGTPPIFSCIQK
jgi:type I site-specific restriction endonuclease